MILEETLEKIKKPSQEAMERCRQHWDSIAKPLHSLGKLEDALVRIAGMTGNERIHLDKKALVVMCADNGVVEEGVTQSGQEVTAIVSENMLSGKATSSIMCRSTGADIFPVDIGIDPYDIQVLTPMRKGLLGVERLNTIFQQYLNPSSPEKNEKDTGRCKFREGDKVMQTRNNYQMEWEVRGKYGIPVDKGCGVFNGDMGIIREINTYAEMVTVEFDECRFAEYSFKELEELELAYALTVHKAQGSEYPAVILPLLNGPRMLMNRNLLYTAVTRARSCVTIVGSPYAVNQMIDNKYEQIRYTSLRQRICEFVL